LGLKMETKDKRNIEIPETVESIMKENVVAISADDSLRQVRRLFHQYRFHHLPVVENGVIIGIVSDRDLLKQLSPFLETISSQPRDRFILNKKAHQIMTRKPITVKKYTSIRDACKTMLTNRISCLPVVDSNRHIKGILTWRDIFNVLLKFYPDPQKPID